jgi:molecular chaperone DnaK
MEGDANQHPSTNKVIAVIEIRADKLMSDLVKGSDIETKIEMSESLDVSMSTHLNMTDQQFEEIFSPTKRYVSLAKLKDEITELRGQLSLNLDKAVKSEEFEIAAEIQEKAEKARLLFEQAKDLKSEGFTDEKYPLDEAKRKLAGQLYNSGTVNNRVIRVKERYYDSMEILQYWLNEMQDMPKKHQDEITKLKEGESNMMRGNNYFLVEGYY